MIVGYRVPGDWLLQKEDVVKDKQFLQGVTLTKTFTGNGKSIITQIKALDQKTNGNGAYATIISGGVGESYVTIKFKSQRNHSIKFKVKLHFVGRMSFLIFVLTQRRIFVYFLFSLAMGSVYSNYYSLNFISYIFGKRFGRG